MWNLVAKATGPASKATARVQKVAIGRESKVIGLARKVVIGRGRMRCAVKGTDRRPKRIVPRRKSAARVAIVRKQKAIDAK